MTTTFVRAHSDSTLLRLLQGLSDHNRLRIVEVLRGGEHCVCELQATLDLGQSLLSHHLKSLRETGLVRARREGRWVHYSLDTEVLAEAAAYLSAVRKDAEGASTYGGACEP
jgi:ArsR family transcriptional regulator, arsenate/arsenite/antimonite-responsive transcriptional repressor